MVVAVGVTVIDAVVAPVDHLSVPVQFEAVKIALSPTQIPSLLDVITGA